MEILYEEEQGYVGLTYEPIIDMHLLHVSLQNWNPSEFKRYLVIWGSILNKLKTEKHLDVVHSLVVTEKEQKFNEVFGFVPTEYGVMGEDGMARRILRLDL